MFRFALKSTLMKKFRLISTAFSVMLGVAFLAGTLVFTDTIRRTFDDLFANIYENTDSWVRSTTQIETPEGQTIRGRVSDTLVSTVRSVPGVLDAQGLVEGYAQLVDAKGKALGDPGRGAPTLGMNYVSGELSPWHLLAGGRAPGDGEMLIDKGSADKGHFKIGDVVSVLTQTGPHSFTVVGVVRFGTADSPGGASVAVFDLKTAQQVLLGGLGQVDAVTVRGMSKLTQTELTARIQAALPAGTEAVTGKEITKEAQDAMGKAFSFFNTFLLVFAVIGIVVACFTIYNTFQIIVSQRTKEMAMLRAIGATRGQVLAAQLLEAVFIGVIASIVGLGVGVLVASGLKGMLVAFGIDVPASGTVLLTRTAVIAVVVGLLSTVTSAVFPSLRASRVAPIAAIREVSIDQLDRPARRIISGSVLTLVGAIGLVNGLIGNGLLWVGIGALLMFMGVFVLSPVIARPVMRVLGAPLPEMAGAIGSLARENATRNPKRTARTGGALMIGVALVTAITVIAASARDWVSDVVNDQFSGDLVVASGAGGFGGISTKLTSSLSALPEVKVATGIRAGAARITGTDAHDFGYVAVDPATAGELFDIGMIQGTVPALDENGILVHDDAAAKHHYRYGDTLQLQFLNGTTRSVRVAGIYTKDQLASSYVISHSLHELSGADQFDVAVFIGKAATVTEAAAKAAVAAAAAAYPNAEVQTRSEYLADQTAQINQLLNLMYGLLGLAVLIALFSIANSIALSVHERTHELGLLRAVGMTRPQTRLSVRLEALLVALLGTGLGVIVGLFFGWSISVTLRDQGLTRFNVPWVSLLVVAVLALVGGLVAAARPSRRAARLDVLRAIASE